MRLVFGYRTLRLTIYFIPFNRLFLNFTTINKLFLGTLILGIALLY